jgi:hypothetical protein
MTRALISLDLTLPCFSHIEVLSLHSLHSLHSAALHFSIGMAPTVLGGVFTSICGTNVPASALYDTNFFPHTICHSL